MGITIMDIHSPGNKNPIEKERSVCVWMSSTILPDRCQYNKNKRVPLLKNKWQSNVSTFKLWFFIGGCFSNHQVWKKKHKKQSFNKRIFLLFSKKKPHKLEIEKKVRFNLRILFCLCWWKIYKYKKKEFRFVDDCERLVCSLFWQ